MTNTVATQAIPASDQYCTTLIEFLLDETGSMSQDSTIAGFNVYLDEQRSQPGTCLLTLTKFDSSTGLKTPFTDIDIRIVPHLARNTFAPGGGTNLRDAIVERARALEDRLAGFQTKPNVIFVVLTDGGDTCSRFCERTVRDTLRARETDGWTFVYRGPKGSGLQVAASLGFRPENSAEFDIANVAEAMADLSRTTTAFRAATRASVAA